MSPQDRVDSMLQYERFCNRYRVTKVTTNMLYAVNLAVGLSTTSDDPATFQQLRTLVHDIQWGGPEPDALFQIRLVDQLHHVPHVIQKVATECYPPDLAMVFRTVHGDAVHNVPRRAPTQTCTKPCLRGVHDIRNGVGSRDMNTRAQRALSSDSRQHQHYIQRVLNDAVLRSVLSDSGPQCPRGHPSGDRRPASSRPSRASGRRSSSTVIPAATRALIPLVNGTQVCIRFQATAGCSFPSAVTLMLCINCLQPSSSGYLSTTVPSRRVDRNMSEDTGDQSSSATLSSDNTIPTSACLPVLSPASDACSMARMRRTQVHWRRVAWPECVERKFIGVEYA
ncbi:hypothetical protein GQ600_7537 [Phytophthora cactorum]|nr:hypothetical protein GQ600_7537 [Phytophthora cactorum]